MNDDTEIEDPSNTGTITEIKEDTFWGVFNDGRTFDMPLDVLDGHGVGTTVLRSSHDPEDFEDQDEAYDQSFMLIGEEYATVIMCNVTALGYEILHVQRYTKGDVLREAGSLN